MQPLPAPAPAAGSTADDWAANTDPSTSRTFYYNAKTQESRWDKPLPTLALGAATVAPATIPGLLPKSASATTLARPASPVPAFSASRIGTHTSSVSSLLQSRPLLNGRPPLGPPVC